MKTTPTSCDRAARQSAALLFCGGLALAQQNPAPVPEDVTILSPFAVSGADDKGYVATLTLAGTRLRTELKDTPIALSVLTDAFLDDIAATDAASMAPYLPSTEVLSLIGGSDSGNTAKQGDTFQVRGFATSTRTRNFFQTAGDNDRYLTDRVTFSRGPNALLFGIGNPGGAVHLSTNRARLRGKAGALDYYYDSFHSHRLCLDQNYALVPDRLALRTNLLWTNTNMFRNPSSEKKQGVFTTTTWNPFDRTGQTQIRLNFEYAKTDRIAARPWAPFDLFSSWLAAGAPLYDNKNSARPATVPTAASPFSLIETRFVDIKAQTAIPMFLTARTTGYNSYVRSSGQIANGAESTFNSITSDFVSLNALDLLRGKLGSDAAVENWLTALGPLRSVPEQWRGGKTVRVPLETWINGDFDIYKKHFNAVGGFLEQTIGENLFVEIAGNIEDARTKNVEPMRSTDISIMYDPNMYLPSGAPNPYAGMPFVGPTAFGREVTDRNTSYEYRITASYVLELKRRKLGRWFDFGRHHLGGWWGQYMQNSDNTSARVVVTKWDGLWIDQNSPLSVQARTLGVGGNGQLVLSRYYLLPGGSPYVPEPWLPVTGDPQKVAADMAYFTGASTRSLNSTAAFSTQSFLLKDRLVLTAGWRRDALSQRQGIIQNFDATNASPQRRNYFGAVDVEGTRAAQSWLPFKAWENRSYGGVCHLVRSWRALDTLSVFYNHATSVSGAVPRRDIYFNEVNPLNGLGIDYGVRVSAFGGKLAASYAIFKTTQTDNFVNTNFRFGRLGFNEVYPVLTIVEPQSAVLARYNQFTSTTAWTPIFDSVTEGREVELVWNVTKDVRMRATYSTHENIISRFGADIEAFMAEHRPIWEKFVTVNYDPTFTGPRIPSAPTAAEQAKTNADYVRQQLASMANELKLKKALNGLPTNGIPFSQASWAGNYTLPGDGWWRGLSTGGNVRYRGQGPLAFKTDANGMVDRSVAFEARESAKLDINVGYRRKVWQGKIAWRVQATVRNAFDQTTPILLAAEWDVTTQRFLVRRNQLVDPRSLVLTSSFGW
ncbi:MAG: hypothetical protein RL077_5389 [Verrucomicrobiota bacterium]|jgi:outer membrane receptor protein involved in Fe transport